MSISPVVQLGERVLRGSRINRAEALALTAIPLEDIMLAAAYANKIRLRFAGNKVDMCGIINARSGCCPEDCRFCAQSVRHKTDIAAYSLLSIDELLARAKALERIGVKRLSLVTSGKGMQDDPDFDKILAAIQTLQQATSLKVCANLGTITKQQAQSLAAAGVLRYAHNLETSERFYPSICTSHPYSERFATLQAARSAGLECCTGGIIGLGESWEDRVDLALTLRELDAKSIPLNILNPIKGTGMEDITPPMPLESLLTIALFRFILPDKIIRPAGGRELNLRDMQGTALLSGANGLIVGNYLTFSGRDTAMDYRMAQDAAMIAQ
jgi:biotin synthase